MDASKRRQHRRRTGFVKLDRSIFNTGVEQSDEILGLYVRLLSKVAYKTCFHRQYKVRPGQMIFSWRDLPELLYRSQKLRPSVNTLRTRMHILETIGAVHIASHPSKRFTVLSIRSVANFDTVAVANSDTVVDTVLDTVLDTVVDTVLDTPTPEISTKTQAKSSPKKEKKEKKEKKVGEGGEAIRRRSLRYLEIQFQDLSEEVREALTLEMIGAVASGAVHPSEVEYRIGAWASKRCKASKSDFWSVDSSTPSVSTPPPPSEPSPSEPQADRPSSIQEARDYFTQEKFILPADEWFSFMDGRGWTRRNGSLVADWREQARKDNEIRVKRLNAEQQAPSVSTPPPTPSVSEPVLPNRVVTSPQRTPEEFLAELQKVTR